MMNVDEFNIKNSLEFYNKMNDNERNEYVSQYLSYSKLFLKYLFEKYDLYKYDKMFEKELFTPVSEEEYDIYQKISGDFSKFLFLRNDLYIERLSKDDREFLNNKSRNNDFELDSKAIDFIERTFRNVVLENCNDSYNILYGPNNSEFIKPCNALVFGFKDDEFGLREGENDEGWRKRHLQQLLSFDVISGFICDSISDELNIPVEVIKYNYLDIKKKDNSKVK